MLLKLPKQLGFVCALITLASCSQTDTKQHTIHPLERNAQNAISISDLGDDQNQTVTVDAMRAALAQYESIDDTRGQWRIHFLVAKFALNKNQTQIAMQSLVSLKNLARQIDSRDISYQTALLAGRITGTSDDFSQALSAASSGLEEAVARIYMGEYEVAIALIEPDALDQPQDRAFVFYQAAKASTNYEQQTQWYQNAMLLYRLANDSRGIADSLASLGQLAQQHGDLNNSAKDYTERAITVLKAIGENDKAAKLSHWLEQANPR